MLMAPFLILQLRPEDEAADDEFAAILRHGGLALDEVQRIRVEREPLPLVELQRYSAILVGGSPFDVSTPFADKSDQQKRVEADFNALLDNVVSSDFPFLGACSGNGLLGSYCGVPITRRFGESVGGIDVCLTEAGSKDPLLHGFPEAFRVLVGHKEACDHVPDGAELLVRGEACPIQMFRLGLNVYATQFHPEGDAEGFVRRIKIYRNKGYFPAHTVDELIAAVEKEEVPFGHEILRRFVERYRRNFDGSHLDQQYDGVASP